MNNTKIKEIIEKENYNFYDLRTIMEILRSEGGCPWDREQTHTSIRNDFLEEAYEAIEGIDKCDDEILKEELGDVLLQVVFHSRIAEEEDSFDVDDVCDGICKKLILRHPHVFADVTADTSDEVLKNWDAIKKVEKNQTTATDTLRAVSAAMPALVRAKKLISKAGKNGFGIKTFDEASADLKSAFDRFLEASSGDSKELTERAAGELLFKTVALCGLCGVNPEEALFRTNEEFIELFSKSDKH